ncbi:CPBP family intramembrane glutamic endopeptidase [Actinoplanes sp. CA-131856]
MSGTVRFLLIFGVAWLALDRLVTSPPSLPATVAALATASAVLVLGLRYLLGQPFSRVPVLLGLRIRPSTARACLVATLIGALVIATYLGGAALLDVRLTLRPNWPAVLVAALLFHGAAEELVWRGFAFGHLRRRARFGRAVALSIPLIALTHVPILITSGPMVGLLALTSAAVTCVPFAWLWERGGHSMWPPAIVHGLVGTWQLWERTYPPQFTVLVVTRASSCRCWPSCIDLPGVRTKYFIDVSNYCGHVTGSGMMTVNRFPSIPTESPCASPVARCCPRPPPAPPRPC